MTLLRPTQISTDPAINQSALTAINGSFDQIESGDPWHYVGQSGQPPFLTGWSNTAILAAFRKTADGTVHVRGEVTKNIGGTVATQDPIFTLPVAYQPSTTLDFIISKATSPPTVADLVIGTNVAYLIGFTAEGVINLYINVSYSARK